MMGGTWAHWCGPETNYPTIIAGEHGKGKTVYLPGKIDNFYQKFGTSDHGQLLLNSVKWITGEQQIKVKAPRTVEVVLREKENCKIIHFINHTDTCTHALVRKTWPIRDVTVTLKNPEKIRKAFTLFSGKKIRWEEKLGEVLLRIPLIKEYEVAVLEYD